MEKIRELGFGELRMHLLHSLGDGTTQGALHVRIEGELDDKYLESVVETLSIKLPILRATIQKIDGRYYFCLADRNHHRNGFLDITVDKNSPNLWQARLEAENNLLLNSEEQLWRLIAVNYQSVNCWDLILVMHHALMDAAGSEFLLDQILGCLGNLYEIGSLESTDNVFPSLEEDAVTACEWEKYVGIQNNIKIKLASLNLQKHLSSVGINERNTKSQYFQVNQDLVAQLEDFCEINQISLNSLFSAALLSSIALCTPDRKSFALFSAVSLRPLCQNVKERSLGCYLNVMPTVHSFSDDSVSSIIFLSREHKIEVQRAFLNTGRWIPRNYDVAIVENMISTLANSNTFGNDIGITYAESGLALQYGKLKVKHQYVTARRNIGNVALILHGLKSDRDIYFSLSHVEPLQSREWAILVKNKFLDLLLMISNSSFDTIKI